MTYKSKSHVFDTSAKGFEELITCLGQRGCDLASTRECSTWACPMATAWI
jgi:hypothetical protein